MGYIIPAGYQRMTLEYASISPMGSQIVTGIGLAGAPSESMLEVFSDWWDAFGKTRTSAAYSLQRLETRSDVEVFDLTVGEQGLLVEQPAPPNTSALLTLNSGLVGRKNRGRMYVPGMLMDDDVNDDGSIDPDALTSIQNVMLELLAAVQTAGSAPVILHSSVGTPTMVTTAAISPVAATQRRRLRR